MTITKEEMTFNAKLQQKKSALRKELAERGILQKGGKNQFDRYTYFTEAQYKKLFTELFSKHGLELTVSEDEYTAFDGTDKQPFGRIVTLKFTLSDCETGYAEESKISGEGLDKGDKAGYKAYTGALKYYLANTFMVATGDDPETESPDGTKAKPKPAQEPKKAPAGADYSDNAVLCKKCGEPIPREKNNHTGEWIEPEVVAEYLGGLCKTCHDKEKEANK